MNTVPAKKKEYECFVADSDGKLRFHRKEFVKKAVRRKARSVSHAHE